MKLDPTLLEKWELIESGWWVSLKCKLGVCVERDKKWHSYVNDDDKPSNTPAFRTMRDSVHHAYQ